MAAAPLPVRRAAARRRTAETPTVVPSIARAQGTACAQRHPVPMKGTMAFLDTAETRTYAMLQQVLRNHATLVPSFSFPHTMGTCGALFALLCAQLDDPREQTWTPR